MSYYQVAESCQFPISDWNYKWDLSPSTICDSNRCSITCLHTPSSEPTQEPDTTFRSKLEPIKDELPDNYQQYERQKTFDSNYTKDSSTDFMAANYGKQSGWSCYSENQYTSDEYGVFPPSNKTEVPRYFEDGMIKDEYDNICISNSSKLGNTTSNWSNVSFKDEYDSSPNQIHPLEWNRHLIKNFNKDECEEFGGTSSHFKVYESFTGSNNLWLMTPSDIKEEYDDDVITLGTLTQNNEHKTNFYHGGLADSNVGRQSLNVVNEASNDSVELLFERAGLEDLMQNSPDALLQIKEFDDLFTEDQSQKQEVKQETDNSEPEVNPVAFNRKHYKCSYCAFNTNGRERLTEHIERLHWSSGYNMRSTRRRRLRNSVDKENLNFAAKEPPTKSKDKSFKCSECSYTTNHGDRLKKHIQKKHFVETYNRYNSWDQDLKFQTPTTVTNRNVNQNQPSAKKPGSKPHKCPQCSYSAHRNDRLMKHIAKIHSKNVCYKCSQCDFVSTYNREYYEHMKSHYGGPPFRCEACSYKSKLITAFIAHRVTHTGDRLFNCTLCSFSCKRKYHLKGHMISHSKEKNFLCPQCSKKYSYKCSLVRHLKTSCKRKPT